MISDAGLLISKTLLQIEYRTLSRLREEFPRVSKHKAVVFIEKEFVRILGEIQDVDEKLNYKR